MPAEQLIIFAKAPRPGLVKTRLAETIGEAGALRAYSALVNRLVENLRGLPEVELRFSPDDAETEVAAWLCPGWTARPQGEGGLGRRLQRAFADAFAAGAQRVVIIGSDCAEITPRDVREAWRELSTHELVLGPALGGGYWLIGLRQPQPALFDGVAWSTDQVLAQTLQRAKAARLSFHLLRILADVDTATEWRVFQEALKR